ncbi:MULTISPECIES: TnsA-like heteromeric transposase endonuclease subunit [unclassified Streptomyces]|uniref:TnsA-like heteromeric transposase endonuclease subunit n=1 Tax=unclassified Streptomyces TaxID=2593676 RepID=UPI000DAE8DAD|nr:integrase [Streptomyces sp. AC1-42W]PZT78743.1 integrase [Streptomyces sp. AC1-42T]
MGEPVHAYGDPALGAFDLDFYDGGERRRTALGSGWSIRFEDVPPVRGFRWNKGDRSFAGWYYAVTTGGHVGYESWLERDRLILLDFAPDVVGIASQPFWLHWREEEAKRRHAPDYFVRLADGRARVVDVRAEDDVDERTAQAFAATERACSAAGWEFSHVGVPDPVFMANVRWLARYRHGRCGRETDVVERLVEVFRRPQGLRAGVEEAGDVLRVLPALFHLLWAGTLHADLGGALLSSGTVVHTVEGSVVGLQRAEQGLGLLRPRRDTRGEGSRMRRLSRPATVGVGDRVRFAGQVRAVLAVSAIAVTLAGEGDVPREVPLAVLLGDEGFEVLGSAGRLPLPPVSLLEALPEHAREKALWWEGHILEVLHGVDPNRGEDAGPRPEYDPARHSLTARERAKAAELTAAGYRVSVSTVGNFRRRYRAEGLLGLADRRPVRKKPQFGTVPDAVVEAMRQAIKEGVDDSTRTGTYIIWRTGEILRENGETVELPSQSTLYRLLSKLTYGKPVSATARNRRSRAHGAKTPFGQWTVFAPGEVVQIDSTPLDVLVRLDDGVVGKVELTGMVDVATRTVPAAVLRPTTKSVDASVLLARALTPEVMRPGWVEALRMSRSVLPYRRLLEVDEHLEHAAAKPVIVPEMIVCDHGKVFISRNFKASCRFLEIDFQPTHKASPFQKGHVEKMLDSVGTLFAQFVAGYTGRSTDHRGRRLDKQPLWSLPELQELLDEWLVSAWQNREHDGLRDPLHPGRSFTPNEKYAALIEACGYVPVALSAEDYVELLPSTWRAVNDYGIRIKRRTYDAPGLIRRQHSGVAEKKGLWEVHHDPYDISRIWVRNHHGDGEWIEATWKHLRHTPVPFGELAWDHAAQGLPKGTEEEIAQAAAALLTRAHAGPQQDGPGKPQKRTRRDKQVAARTKATPPVPTPPPAAEPDPVPEPEASEEEAPLAKVIPLGLFDPLADPWKRS